MSQHQQAFQPDCSDDVSRIALHALAVLSGGNKAPAGKPTAVCDLSLLLYDAAVSPDADLIRQAVTQMRELGVSHHEIKTVYVPAIARKLGDSWLNDTATFSDVTVGCARLQATVRRLESTEEAHHIHVANKITPRNCLVVVPEGAQHTVGAVVLTDQLRTVGADVTLALGVGGAAAARLVRSQPFHAVMISASSGESIEKLRGLVQSARQNCADSKIFLGGGIVQHRSDLAIATGSDYVSCEMQKVMEPSRPDCNKG
jgi:methylmalonyl-CoA mutase cobalamin-binding subunit